MTKFYLISFFLIGIIAALFLSGCNKKEETKELQEAEVKIFLVALQGSQQTGKAIDCNDVLVEVRKNVVVEKSELESALNELINEKSTDDLKNFVKGPNLFLYQVYIAGGIADVYLKGDFAIFDKCDVIRIEQQLLSTVNQFTQFKKINIFINNQTFSQYMSISNQGF